MSIVIRPSSLTGYQDCPRRTAARLFRAEVEDAGYSLRDTPNGIGAAVGTATHSGAHVTLKARIDVGEWASEADAEDAAIASLREGVAEGIEWDQVSPTANTAEKQVRRQLRAWRHFVAPQFVPEHVEVRLEADMGGGVTVSGQVDVAAGQVIRDLKTGRVARANGSQYGMYSLLWQAHGHTINGLIEDYVPRAPISKLQPEPITREIDIADAEAAAMAIAKRMVADLAVFREKGDPWAFIANPASQLCGSRWCPAWGTAFCRAHAGAKA